MHAVLSIPIPRPHALPSCVPRTSIPTVEPPCRVWKVVQGSMLGVVEGIMPSSEVLDLPASSVGMGLPLRLQHRPTAVGPTLRAPPVKPRDVGRAGWFTRLCEHLFGW